MGFINLNKANNNIRAREWCSKQWRNYQTCLQHKGFLYDVSYDILMKNKTKIIEDIAYSLNISHVMWQLRVSVSDSIVVEREHTQQSTLQSFFFYSFGNVIPSKTWSQTLW